MVWVGLWETGVRRSDTDLNMLFKFHFDLYNHINFLYTQKHPRRRKNSNRINYASNAQHNYIE